MSEYAVMPLEDWQNILDAVRVKLKSTDLLRSGEVGDAIRSIMTGTVLSGEPITSEAEFLAMKEDGDYYLANDITVSTSYGTFRGRLYGNSMSITTSVPLFESLEGASVYDLTIKGTVDFPNVERVGALAGSATSMVAYRVVNEADVTAKKFAGGIIGYATDTCVFWGCINAGSVYSSGGYAAGILAFGGDNATFTNCSNIGTVTMYTDASYYYYGAGGIVSWVGGTGILHYCVNLGHISSNWHVGGLGARFGEDHDRNGHIVFGCVSIGHLRSTENWTAGLVRRTYGRSGFNYNTVSGSVKSDVSKASGLVGYSNSADTNYNNNIVKLGRYDIEGAEVFLSTAGAPKSTTEYDSNFTDIYALADYTGIPYDYFFGRADDTFVEMPTDYSYYFSNYDIEDESVMERLDDNFVMVDGMPMHRGVVGTYRLAQEYIQADPAVLTVSFGRESESDEGEEEFYLRTDSGAYTVDGGEAVYFEDEADLTITELSIGSVVEIMPRDADGSDVWYNAKNEIGCTSTLDGETAEGLFSCGGETVRITVTEDVASITVYQIYY